MGIFPGRRRSPNAKPVKASKDWKSYRHIETLSLHKSKRLPKPLTYPYTALNADLLEIRVLKILPGHAHELLNCTLHHTSLLSNTLRYESISYCWGESLEEEIIVIDGVQVAVRCSAATAIRRMRKFNISRLVWIDGICIDQSTKAEKSQQVALMGQIYSKTIRNLIWLGKDTGPKAELETTLSAVLDNAYACTEGFQMFWSTICHSGERAIDGTLLDREIDLVSLGRLFESDWFSRVWVVQEAALAPRNLCHFGDTEISLPEILRVAAWLSFNQTLVHEWLIDMPGLQRACNMWFLVDSGLVPSRLLEGVKYDLHLLYFLTRKFEASEPRDKVFALLGMFKSNKNQSTTVPRPDYEQPLLEVYRDATRFMIENSKSLSILQSHMAVEDPETSSCPTWVVDFAQDWNYDQKSVRLESFCPDNREGLQVVSATADPGSPNRLVVAGIVVDEISMLTSVFSTAKIRSCSELSGLFAQSQRIVDSTLRLADQDGHKAMAFTLIAGITCQRHRATQDDVLDYEMLLQYLQSRNQCPPDIRHLNRGKSDATTWRASSYWTAMERICSDRRFFVTKNGHIGLGPAGLKATDNVTVLFGGKVPFVLRPRAENTYELIGECYVYGIMYGEAVRQHRRRGGLDHEFIIV